MVEIANAVLDLRPDGIENVTCLNNATTSLHRYAKLTKLLE
jgi:hypothetical protein